jgi:hypothetical protein
LGFADEHGLCLAEREGQNSFDDEPVNTKKYQPIDEDSDQIDSFGYLSNLIIDIPHRITL